MNYSLHYMLMDDQESAMQLVLSSSSITKILQQTAKGVASILYKFILEHKLLALPLNNVWLPTFYTL